MMIICYAIDEKNKPLSQKVPDRQCNAVLCSQEGEKKFTSLVCIPSSESCLAHGLNLGERIICMRNVV